MYHSAFKQVLEAADTVIPFTTEQIVQEFNKRNTFGFMYSSILIPVLVAEAHDVLDFDLASGGRANDFVEELRQNAVRMLANNPLLKPRLNDLFEDLIESKEMQYV